MSKIFKDRLLPGKVLAPTSVQTLGRRLEEKKLLSIAQIIVEAIGISKMLWEMQKDMGEAISEASP